MKNKKYLFRFSPLTDSDVPRVLELYRQCEDFLALGPVPTASLQMVQADMALTRPQGGVYGGIFIAPGEAGGDWILAGVLDIIPTYAGEPDCTFIELLMIGAPYRGRGLGQAVVEWLLAQRPNLRLKAGVQVNNPSAIRFWQSLGFRITGPAAHFEDGTTAFPIELSVNS